MKKTAIATDNISELLVKIIEFTQLRQKILILNIKSMNDPVFAPRDLAVEEFSDLMTIALKGHNAGRKLIFCDGPHIKFGPTGSFSAAPLVDSKSKMLIKQNPNDYLHHQINKLLENALNHKIALQLLKNRQADEKCLRGSLN
jgi:flagellar basal body rod protein FlgB